MLVSNVRDEDIEDLLAAVRLLQQRHLVCVASLRERELDAALEDEVQTLEDAAQAGAAALYLQQRAKAHEALRSEKVMVLDVTADALPAAGCAVLSVAPMPPVRESSRHPGPRTEGGAGLRIAIESISPAVDDGAHPVKCVVHERITVQADLLMDGHDRIAAELRWRAADEPEWRRAPLRLLANDRWQASFRPRRIGPHEFQVAAWRASTCGWKSLRARSCCARPTSAQAGKRPRATASPRSNAF
ncbi:hypothetical protein G6F65_019294 [Rhizopus arrhizus]|nr:hypothetical protein G6F65_019294 [Rhizopus arrhizus]